jgi:hypothetical protein
MPNNPYNLQKMNLFPSGHNHSWNYDASIDQLGNPLLFSSFPHLIPFLCLHEFPWFFTIKLNATKSWKNCQKTRNMVWNIHLQKLLKNIQPLSSKHTHTQTYTQNIPPLIKANFDTYFVNASSLLNLPPQIPLSNQISSPTLHWCTQKQLKVTTFSRH